MKRSILIMSLLLAAPAFGCDMCRDAKPTATTGASSQEVAEAGLGFNSSIYFMLGSLGVAGVLAGRSIYKSACGNTPQD